MSRRALRLTGLLAGAVAAACSGGPSAAVPPAGPTSPAASPAAPQRTLLPDEIPTTWVGDVVFVEASIDGRGPYRLLLDSGCSVPLLTPRVVESLELERVELSPGGEGAPLATGGGALAIQQAARVAEFHAGPFRLRDTGALIVDLSPFEAALGARVDGFLPVTAFREGVLTLDIENGRVTFVAGELPPADGDEVLDLLETDHRPFVAIDVAGYRCPALVDSGFVGFLSLPRNAEEVLAFRSPVVVVGRTVTLAGELDMRAGRVDGAITWGPHTLDDPVVSVAQDRHAKIGTELLREFRVSFDLRNRRIRFTRTSSKPLTCPPLRSTGYGVRVEDGAWVVEFVLDGSPAARAGLDVGDRIETVDGTPVGDLELASSADGFDPGYVSVLRIVGSRGTREIRVGVATLVE